MSHVACGVGGWITSLALVMTKERNHQQHTTNNQKIINPTIAGFFIMNNMNFVIKLFIMKQLKILSSLLVVCLASHAYASDCIGPDCDIEPFAPQVMVVPESAPVDSYRQTVIDFAMAGGACCDWEMAEIMLMRAENSCPFDTEWECRIWRRKPMVKESVAPRSPRIRDVNIDAFVAAAQCDANIDATADAAAPLLARYRMLMNATQACCTEGMIYTLRNAGASNGLVYKYLVDDANFYGFNTRCLMMSDEELAENYSDAITPDSVATVRDKCLCRGREWFWGMLAPFTQIYDIMPEFAYAPFNYTYIDGLGRETTVSVNQDVQNVLYQLQQCP